jgi:uncharacterized protein involved in tolerance to divalent cations
MNYLAELVITCASWQEAQRIADGLLEKQLVNSIESFEIKPRHWWEGDQQSVQRVKLLVMAPTENFSDIQRLANKLHHVKSAPILLTELIK